MKQTKTKIKTAKKPRENKDLTVFCLICKSSFVVKGNARFKRFSLFNNGGYLTDQPKRENEGMCNSCLLKLHYGSIGNWTKNKKKATGFRKNVNRGKYEK